MTEMLAAVRAQTCTYGYLRVSDERGRQGKANFHAPVEYRETIERFCAARGWDLTDVIEAIDQSSKGGANFRTTEFQALLAKLRRGDRIVVPAYDRFGRDLRESLNMIVHLEEAGVDVLSATQTAGNDSSGRLSRNIFFSFAQYQLDRITENWTSVHTRLHAAGVTHGQVPYGYVRPKINDSPQPLEPNPEEAPVVSFIFHEIAKGTPITALVAELEEMTGRMWIRQTVRKMLGNRAYLGEVHRGKRTPIIDAHEPLVPRSVWEAAQKPKVGRVATKRDYLLTGITRCGSCGHKMQYSCNRYACTGTNHKCPRRLGAVAALVEKIVVDEFLAKVSEYEFIASELDVDVVTLEAALMEAQEDYRDHMRDKRLKRLNEDEWYAEAERLDGVVKASADAVRDAYAKSGRGDGMDATTIADEWEHLSNLDRRFLLATRIESVTIVGRGKQGARTLDPERVQIKWR